MNRLNTTILFLALLFIFLISGSSQTQAQYVRANGTQILDKNGSPIFFRGMNLGNWLLWEGYLMMGDYEYRTHTQVFDGMKRAFGNNLGQAIEFEHQWRLNYVTEQTIIDLKNLGFNSVRVPFHFNMFWDYGTNAPRNHGFQYIDRVVNWSRTHGLYVLLDMHAAPGYQNPGDHSDNVNSNATQPRNTVTFWDGNNVNIASTVWRHIANYYKNEPVIWGYDLINEPVPQAGREYELLRSFVTMRNAIRAVDVNHCIVAEGSWWGSDMSKIDWMDGTTAANSGINYRWDNNLVYQTHHYSDDVNALNGRKTICNKLNVPLILGEYGENTDAKLREMTNWCQNNNVGYFPWSFKKMYHAGCLWTIHPNANYNAVRDFIKNGGTAPANAYNNMISFCQNNIANGKPGFSWHQGWYDAVKYTGGSGIVSGAVYSVISVHSNKAMEVSNFSTADGGRVQQWDYVGAASQKWRITDVGGGVYNFININSGKALDVAGVSTANGAVLHQWAYVGGNNQKWHVIANGDGTYRIISVHSGKAADVNGVSTANGAYIHQWDYVGGGHQKWRLTQVSASKAEDQETVTGTLGNLTSVKIYPNPSFGSVNIEVEGEASVSLANASGVEILKEKVTGSKKIEGLASGFYLVHIKTVKGFATRKLLVK